MKNILILFTLGVLFASCADKETQIKTGNLADTKNINKVELEYVDKWNQIEFAQTDDKYGEWGGDTEIILVYSDGKKYYANYAKHLGSQEPLIAPIENKEIKKWYEYKKLDFKIDSVKLDQNKIALVENAILGLVKQKIQNPSYISHSGIYNSVITRDSSLVIDDFPSGKWLDFQKLKNSLTKK